MKISEGVRLGSQGRHEIRDAYFDKKGGACAIGALMLLSTYSENVLNDFPGLTVKIDEKFDTGYTEKTVLNGISGRNKAGWSFGQIIEWLESIGQ